MLKLIVTGNFLVLAQKLQNTSEWPLLTKCKFNVYKMFRIVQIIFWTSYVLSIYVLYPERTSFIGSAGYSLFFNVFEDVMTAITRNA